MVDHIQSLLMSLEKNYAIEKEVGRGGMGVVYKGIDKRLERPVAIKVLNLGSGGETEQNQALHSESVERFRREAKVIARLAHPNIVSIYDVGEAFQQYYMIMEFAEGKPLSSLVREGRPVPAPVVTSVAAQICSALAYAHENKIIHRDIKPANIIVSAKGLTKLMDFGIAQLHTEGSKLTQAGSMMGSLMYTSPEQLNDASQVDERTDIYALGVTMYELLTGQSPYQSQSLSQLIMEILANHQDANAIRTINPDVPEVLELVVARAMKKNPQERYASAYEMASDLGRLLQTSSMNQTLQFQLNFNDSTSDLPSDRQTTRFRDSSLIRKTTIDTELVKALKMRRQWLPEQLQSWKKQVIAQSDVTQVLTKLIEPVLIGDAISGVLVIDSEFYIFVEKGLLVGACHLQTSAVDDSVFSLLPKQASLIELFIPEENQPLVPALLAQIISGSGQVLQQNLDSSLVDLLPLVEALSNRSDPFTGYVIAHAHENLYYYGFEAGQECLAICAQTDTNRFDSWSDIKLLVQEPGVLLDIYQASPRLVGPSLTKLLSACNLNMSYVDVSNSTLQNIVDMGTEEVPIHLIQEAKKNLKLDLECKQTSNVISLGQVVDNTRLIQNSLHLKLSEWLTREYFYLLNSTGSTNSLKYIYSWIPAIESIAFEEDLDGDDGLKHRFQWVNHGQVAGEKYKKILALAAFGNGSQADLNAFIDRVITVKKHLIKTGDIGGAFYVSTEPFETEALKLFYTRTVEPRKGLLGSLDTLTKYKGFVRIGMNRGFHLNLLEYRAEQQGFEVIAPLLK